MPEFLRLVDNFIHGAVVTVAIDKQIDTVFGRSKKETYPLIEEQLSAMGSVNGRVRQVRRFFAVYLTQGRVAAMVGQERGRSHRQGYCRRRLDNRWVPSRPIHKVNCTVCSVVAS